MRYPTTADPSTAREKFHKWTLGRAFTIEAHNSAGIDLYLHIWDQAGDPTVGQSAGLVMVKIPADSTGGKSWPDGRPFNVGAVAALSTSKETYQEPAGDFGWFEATY